MDGIRAIAVALVLADHGGVPRLSGGFLGVDVFFVLSGFLITSLLLDERGRTGAIGLRRFWIRRARRLLPALLVMVLARGGAPRAASRRGHRALRGDAVASFFWMSNWAFVARQDRLLLAGRPAVAAAAHVVARRSRSSTTCSGRCSWWPSPSARLLRAPDAATGRLVLARRGRCCASATATIVFTTDASLNRIYFGTDTRAQALLVGAAAAALLVRDWSVLNDGGTLIRTRWGRVGRPQSCRSSGWRCWGRRHTTRRAASAISAAGLLIVVALAAVLVVASVALEQDGPVARVLAWRPLVWLGAISYGVYLWHWPIFLALNGERTGWSGWPLFALRCAATVTLAAASWWLLEQPIRRWRPRSSRCCRWQVRPPRPRPC